MRALCMNYSAAFGTGAGCFGFLFKAGVTALVRGLDTRLSGLGIDADTLNRLQLGYAEACFRPSVAWRSPRLRFTLDLPLGHRRYWLGRGAQRPHAPSDALLWKPRLLAEWSPSARLSLTVVGTAGPRR